jgi:TPR repeat protein
LVNAQHNLGCIYSEGRGVQQDDNEALKWFRLAAEQECKVSAIGIAAMYRRGRGVTHTEGIRWLKVAAENGPGDQAGDRSSQEYLGWIYGNGKIVPLDYEESRKWFELAAAQGSDYAKQMSAQIDQQQNSMKQNGTVDWLFRRALKWKK